MSFMGKEEMINVVHLYQEIPLSNKYYNIDMKTT